MANFYESLLDRIVGSDKSIAGVLLIDNNGLPILARGIASEYQQYAGYLVSATSLASRSSVSAPLFPQVVVEPVTNSVTDCQPGQQPNLGVLRVDIDAYNVMVKRGDRVALAVFYRDPNARPSHTPLAHADVQ
jgi:hypothetical protein